jgi:RNA polymerase sigma-70 factor (ECF subfamily)
MAQLDPELVARAQAGEQEAYAALVQQLVPRLRAVVASVLGHTEEAEDCIQEALLRGWKHLSTLRDPQQIGSWLARIARNEAVTWLRRNRKRPTVEVSPHHSIDDPAQRAEDEEVDPRAVVLPEAMSALRANYREILLLKYEAACDYQAIAEILDISVANVEKRLYRARQALQKQVEKRVTAK